ncbi:secondary thiamine-phosphate synthase enzyme YjbQ [Methylomarinum vadi]|uniref:secondary thiamine-phosphate synthase enzyme YjbQ n=1 Tax=Methylomarinum vadi TaxID=438855 RepID=UPI0004DFC2B2|nr:secondary thiamine-phosphate synthase enzyme YjbQ [Methylomarinum vadi]
MWIQKKIKLPAMSRGFHLITRHITNEIPELKSMRVGLVHIFMQHTSASLAINENADPDVRHDMEAYFSKTVPENEPYYRHVLEGADDMPAHIKSVLLGESLTVPVSEGRLALGTWQGIYLCEHRNHAAGRTLMVTLNGE